MAMFTKKDLKTGMFGKEFPSGDLFVVAGDKLVYENGLYDSIDEVDEKLEFEFGEGRIEELYEADCFQQIKDGRAKPIWMREDEPVEPVKPVEGAITITEEQFFEAVTKANDKFMEIGAETPVKHDELLTAMMGLQNTAFGALIGAVLFGKEIE